MNRGFFPDFYDLDEIERAEYRVLHHYEQWDHDKIMNAMMNRRARAKASRDNHEIMWVFGSICALIVIEILTAIFYV